MRLLSIFKTNNTTIININRKYIFLIFLSAFVMMGCNDSDFYIGQEKEENIKINLLAIPTVQCGGSRATDFDTSVDEYAIKDIWLIEYNDNGEKIGKAQYFTAEEIVNSSVGMSVILPGDGKTFKLVALANTHRPNFSEILDYDARTISDLAAICKNYYGEEDGYNSKESEPSDLLMNGIENISSDIKSLDIKLFRNVAKLTVTITNKPGSGVTIKSVQVKNVPDKISFADQLIETPAPKNSLFFNLPKKEWNANLGDGCMNLSYLIPRNNQIVRDVNNTLTSQKNNYAPATATYVEINASCSSGAIVYRFYLGKNMTDNFQVLSNYHYILPIIINNPGDATIDSRIETFDNVIVCKSSNSYIINYINKDAANSYYIPIDRINTFWENAQNKDPNCNVKDDTYWIAEIIWQDVNTDLIRFINDDGSESTTYVGKGITGFKVKATGNCPGNVVVGIRPRNNSADYGYSWSWHLWVTDYVPEYDGPMKDGDMTFPTVSGDHVMQLATDYWKKNHNGQYIMDRNYGAHRANPAHNIESGVEESGNLTGVFYFYCRKDPFVVDNTSVDGKVDIYNQVYRIYKYDENDNLVRTHYKYVTTKATMEMTVKHPATVYLETSGSTVWYEGTQPLQWPVESWQTAPTDGSPKKSFYDPSPEGWRIAEREIWWDQDFLNNHLTDVKEEKNKGNYLTFDNNLNNNIFLPYTSFLVYSSNHLTPQTSTSYISNFYVHDNSINGSSGQFSTMSLNFVNNWLKRSGESFYRTRLIPIRPIKDK